MNRRRFLSAVGVLAACPNSSIGALPSQENRLRVIDTHMHIFNSDEQGKNGVPRYMPPATVEYTLRVMDRGGVDKGFLISYNAEDIAIHVRYREESPVALKPVINAQYQYESWRAHRDRFWWFTGHVRPIREGFMEDLENDVEKGASGIKLLPIFHGLLPDHPAWTPVYELARKRQKPIILDLSWWYFDRYTFRNESRERQKLASSFKTFSDYARLFAPIIEEYSSVAFSLAHCGTPRGPEDYEDIFATIAAHPNLSCDLAAIPDYSPAFLERPVKAVGARRIMYGTDSPYWFQGGWPVTAPAGVRASSMSQRQQWDPMDSYKMGTRRWTLIAEEATFLSDEEKRWILAKNAENFAQNRLPVRE